MDVVISKARSLSGGWGDTAKRWIALQVADLNNIDVVDASLKQMFIALFHQMRIVAVPAVQVKENDAKKKRGDYRYLYP